MQANDLQNILALLERQQIALASQSEDAIDRLDSINSELQRLLQRLPQPDGRFRHALPQPLDQTTLARIHQLLIDNRNIMLRLSDNNRRALQVLFKSEPLVYSR
ncbi:MAG: hypothetical protein Q4A16_06400 [Lautropia sp.]|nr:hypothetical protein [Lautropia sp.]